jgi:hypothetical protein
LPTVDNLSDLDALRLPASAIALGLILGFMAVEVAVGIAVSSLALLSDAAHMLTDAAALGLAIVALGSGRERLGSSDLSHRSPGAAASSPMGPRSPSNRSS